jgi:alpha-galactosidase
MGPQPTLRGWSLHDPTRTNAEVIADFYELLREAVGSATLLNSCPA